MRGKEVRKEGNIDLIEICYFFQSKKCDMNTIMPKKERRQMKNKPL